jgi:hypothetical protein
MGTENRTGQYDFDNDPALANVLRVWLRKQALAIRTATLGTVTAYDPVTQEASVTVDILQVQRVTQTLPDGRDPNETNEVQVMAPVALTKVPVLFCNNGAGTYGTIPILPGCTGMLIVLDRSKDTWVNRTQPIPVDPVKSTIHSLADCVFVPGVTDRAHRLAVPTSLTAMVWESAAIQLGETATSNLVKAELLDALDGFANAVPVPGDGGAAIQAAFKVLYTIVRPTLATTKVTAE